MLSSLAQQSAQPVEMVIVDASADSQTEQLFVAPIPGLETDILYRRAEGTGAALQRNEALAYTSYDHVLFLDDDIVFEADCLARMWRALEGDNKIGGVNATIVNQQYSTPGKVSRTLFRLLHGRAETSYAGKCIGPALNLLPEDRAELPEVVPVEWLNTTCALYRKAALPEPPFPEHFVGYSFMEDVALSLAVGKEWKLANARTARIFHDSQPAEYKNNQAAMAKMELVNRHFIMARILGRTKPSDYLKLALLETFGVATSLTSARGLRALPSVLVGKAGALRTIVRGQGKTQNGAAITKDRKQFVSN
jgi:GT2 family glycosyltransferase